MPCNSLSSQWVRARKAAVRWVRCGLPIAMLVIGACTEDPPCASRSGHVCTIAGTGELGFNRDGLPPTETDLFLLSSVRRGPDGLVYLMDFNNQRLRRIDADGVVRTVIGSGFHALATIGIGATETALENPIDFRFFSDGRIVFVSYHDPRVLELGHDGTLHAVAGAGEVGVEGDEGDGGPALSALFIQPDGIAVAPDDSVYVSDSLANRVRLVRDGIITTVAGTGVAEYAGDGGPGVDASLHWPTALVLDPEGNLFIADTRNHAVRRLATDGTMTTVAGSGTPGAHGDGGPATEAQLDQPYGLALEADGTLYIADRGNFRIRRVSPNGMIETLAGTGVEGAENGPAESATFGYVARLALDDDGLLVADQSSSLARRIDLSP